MSAARVAAARIGWVVFAILVAALAGGAAIFQFVAFGWVGGLAIIASYLIVAAALLAANWRILHPAPVPLLRDRLLDVIDSAKDRK